MNTAKSREVRGVMHYNAILRSTIDRSRARRSRRRGRAAPSTAPIVRVAAAVAPGTGRARSRPHVIVARQRPGRERRRIRAASMLFDRRHAPPERELKTPRCTSSAPSTAPTVRVAAPFDPGSGRARSRPHVVAARRRPGRERRCTRAASALFDRRPAPPERELKTKRQGASRMRRRQHPPSVSPRRSTREVIARDRDLMSSRRVGVPAASDGAQARRARYSTAATPLPSAS
jgi:hypothetical protein